MEKSETGFYTILIPVKSVRKAVHICLGLVPALVPALDSYSSGSNGSSRGILSHKLLQKRTDENLETAPSSSKMTSTREQHTFY